MNADAASIQQAKSILAGMRTASLGTVNDDGSPFVSLVTVAPVGSSQAAMLLSQLAVHTRNLQRDPRCSLLLIEPGGEGGNPLAGARLTLTGATTRIERSDDDEDRTAFLARHADAAMYADFGDFAFHRFTTKSAHLVAGFGRIVTIPASDLA